MVLFSTKKEINVSIFWESENTEFFAGNFGKGGKQNHRVGPMHTQEEMQHKKISTLCLLVHFRVHQMTNALKRKKLKPGKTRWKGLNASAKINCIVCKTKEHSNDDTWIIQAAATESTMQKH